MHPFLPPLIPAPPTTEILWQQTYQESNTASPKTLTRSTISISDLMILNNWHTIHLTD